MQGSNYILSNFERPKTTDKSIRKPKKLFVLFAAFSIIFSVLGLQILATSMFEQAAVNNIDHGNDSSYIQAEAFCSDPNNGSLGSYMGGTKVSWNSILANYPAMEETNRYMTLRETSSNSVVLPTFSGTGSVAEKGFPLSSISSDGLTTDQVKGFLGLSELAPGTIEKFESARSSEQCITTPAARMVANIMITLTEGVTSLSSTFSSMAFNPNLVCSGADGSGEVNCINLLGVIGGDGKNGNDGIIGNLTNNLYFPLLALCALITGAWVIWVGIAKKAFIKALQGVLWTVISVVLGVFVLSMPQTLAKAPMFINNEIVAVLFTAFSGGSNGGADGVANFCSSSAGNEDRVAFAVNNMNCQIWKAFVLEPYAQSAFGTNLNSLNIGSPAETVADKAIAAAGIDPNSFCYNMKTSATLSSQWGSTLVLSGDDNMLCNLAAAQILVGSNVAYGDNAPPPSGQIDPRWLEIAAVAAADEGMWSAWAGNHWWGAIGYSFTAALATLAATLVIIVISFWALVFYLISIIMMVFAPFFLLIGIIPGKGKRILMTWLQTVLGNIMKYMASAAFLIITVSIYAGVLSQMGNVITISVFVVVLTGALLMYRKEIMNLLGQVDLGGVNIANKAGSFASRIADRSKGIAMATTGAAIGGALANGFVNPLDPEQVKKLAESTGQGALSGAMRSVKSKNDFLGNTVRSVELNKKSIRTEVLASAKDKADSNKQTKENLSEAVAAYEANKKHITLDSTKITDNNKAVSQNQEAYEAFDDAVTKVLLEDTEVSDRSPEYAEWRELINQAMTLSVTARVHREQGDFEGAAKAESDFQKIDLIANAKKRAIDPDEFSEIDKFYKDKVVEMSGSNKSYEEQEGIKYSYFQAAESNRLLNESVMEAKIDSDRLSERVIALRAQDVAETAIIKAYEGAVNTKKAKENGLSANDVEKLERDAAALAEEARKSALNDQELLEKFKSHSAATTSSPTAASQSASALLSELNADAIAELDTELLAKEQAAYNEKMRAAAERAAQEKLRSDLAEHENRQGAQPASKPEPTPTPKPTQKPAQRPEPKPAPRPEPKPEPKPNPRETPAPRPNNAPPRRGVPNGGLPIDNDPTDPLSGSGNPFK